MLADVEEVRDAAGFGLRIVVRVRVEEDRIPVLQRAKGGDEERPFAGMRVRRRVIVLADHVGLARNALEGQPRHRCIVGVIDHRDVLYEPVVAVPGPAREVRVLPVCVRVHDIEIGHQVGRGGGNDRSDDGHLDAEGLLQKTLHPGPVFPLGLPEEADPVLAPAGRQRTGLGHLGHADVPRLDGLPLVQSYAAARLERKLVEAEFGAPLVQIAEIQPRVFVVGVRDEGECIRCRPFR